MNFSQSLSERPAIKMKVHYAVIVICLLGGIQALDVGNDFFRGEPKGIISRIFHALFPPLDPLPEDLIANKVRPIKPIVSSLKGEAASLLGLLGSIVGRDVSNEHPVTQKPTVVRVSVTVPPADRYYKPELYRKRRQTNFIPALPANLGAIFNQGLNLLPNMAFPQEIPTTLASPQYSANNPQHLANNNPQYPAANNSPQQYQTPAPYENQQYQLPPAYNQTYNQSYGYSTTGRPPYYYTTLKPRPAPPVVINVTLPTTTTTTTTYKPYTIKYNKPYKPYNKPSYNAPYTPYNRK